MTATFRTDCYADAQIVRERVFMDEQGFANEFEPLDEDACCVHVTAYDAGELIGCARIFPADAEGQTFSLPAEADGACGKGAADQDGGRSADDRNAGTCHQWVFGRLAVLPFARKGGFGSAILAECERVAKERGATELHLHAQCNAAPFYEKNGYASYGPIELDEHVEHQWMRKAL